MIEIGFFALTFLSVLLVLFLLQYHPDFKSISIKYVLAILIWTIYVAVISNSGLLNNFNLPPRLPLLIVLPAILITFILTGSRGIRIVMQRAPLHLPIFLQSFRILVELLIYFTFLEEIIPQLATFGGINFDILVGISAIFIGFMALKNNINLTGLILWNILSICILMITVYAFVYSYYFTDFVLIGEGRKLMEFPFILLPGYLLPLAIFLHIFSIRQILTKVKSNFKTSIIN